MVFNKGDIVVCIDNNNDKFRITIGKQYEVLYDVDYQNDLLHVAFDTPGIGKENGGQEKPWIIIKDDLGNQQSLMKSQFMLLEDWRQQQLDKLL
jgi:hypothetical protein